MTEADIFETIREIVADKLGIPEEEIQLDSDFIEDLGADSLYLNEIVYELEEEFNVRVPDEALEDLRTVGQAVKFVHERVRES